MLITKMSICTEYQSEQDLGLISKQRSNDYNQTLHSFISCPLMSAVDLAPATLTLTAVQYPDL